MARVKCKRRRPSGESISGEPCVGGGRLLLRLYLTFLILIGPIKFGCLVQATEISFYPMSWLEVLLGIWPAWIMPILAGAGLILAGCLRPGFGRFNKASLVSGIWGVLALVGLIGLIRTTEWNLALLFVWHLLGVFCFALSVFWTVQDDPGAQRWFLVALAGVSLWVCFAGWRQVPFGGLEEMERYVQQQAHGGNAALPGGLGGKLSQRRAYGSFVYPNSYAAHILLVGPLLVFLLWQAGRRVEPVRISQVMFAGGGLVLALGGLLFSGSRAGVVALGGSLVFGAFRVPGLKRLRILLGVVCLLGAVLLMVAVNRGRGLSSLEARTDYWRAAVEMVKTYPLTGVGWGEFFPHYMRLKTAAAEETRQPHCAVLAFASQAGLLAAFALGLCYLLPLLARYGLEKSGFVIDAGRFTCVEMGMVAWLLHSLADFNVQIPGTLMLVAAFPFLGLVKGPGVQVDASRWDCRRIGAVLVGVLAVCGVWRVLGERAYQELLMDAQRGVVSVDSLLVKAEKVDRLLPSADPWVMVGRVAARRADAEGAVKAYTMAVRRSPHRAAHFSHLADNLVRLGRIEEARLALTEALKWYPAKEKYREMAQDLGLLLPQGDTL